MRSIRTAFKTIPILGLFIVILPQVGCITPSNEVTTARWYTPLSSNLATKTFFLLSEKKVQDDLNLTHNQLNRIRTDLRQKGSKSSLSGDLIKSNMTESQRQRFEQLLLQMEGPWAIVNEPRVSNSLKLTIEQLQTMQAVSKLNHDFRQLLMKRYASLQLNPDRPDRSESNLKNELLCLRDIIEEVGRDDDAALLAILDARQRTQWENMQGVPLNLKWHSEALFEIPSLMK